MLDWLISGVILYIFVYIISIIIAIFFIVKVLKRLLGK